MKQPVLGVSALVVVIVISFGIISLFDEATFSTWVSFLFMCCVPTQLLFAMVWRTNFPSVLGAMAQPTKGLLLTGVTIIIGMIFAAISYYGIGGGHGVTPMLLMYIIMTVVVSFWYVACWQCWPVSLFTQSPLALGVSMLVVAYLGAYLLFQWLFDFSFLQGAPVYYADIDPQGIFFAWTPLVIGVTTVSVILALVLFDLWPVGKITDPSLRVIAFSLLVATVAYGIYFLCTTLIGMDQIRFLVTVPISFIFGIFLPLNLLQGSMFPEMKQPGKGVLLVAVCSIAAVILQNIYLALGPVVSGPLASGVEGHYQEELWLASALLGVTFPVLVVQTDYLNFWPLKPRKR
jgi:hypothetical protein